MPCFHPLLNMQAPTQPTTSQAYLNINQYLLSKPEQTTLIGVIEVKPQHLRLFCDIEFHQSGKEDYLPLVYLSDCILIEDQPFRLIYLPHCESKRDGQYHEFLAGFIKQFSDVCIGDISSIHLKSKKAALNSEIHSLKNINKQNQRNYAIISNEGGQAYEVKFHYSNKMEIVNKLRPLKEGQVIHADLIGQITSDDFFGSYTMGDKAKTQRSSISQTNTFYSMKSNTLQPNEAGTLKRVNLPFLIHILHSNIQKYRSMLNSNNSLILGSRVRSIYYLECYLREESIKYREMAEGGKMLSLIELELLEQEIAKYLQNSGQSQVIADEIIKDTMRAIRQTNHLHLCHHLMQLRENFTATHMESLQELEIKKETVLHLLRLYGIDPFLILAVIQQKEKEILELELKGLKSEKQDLHKKKNQGQKEIIKLGVALSQYKLEIQDYMRKSIIYKQLNNELKIVSQNLQFEQNTVRKLRAELQSHQFIQKKNNEIRFNQQLSLKSLAKERSSLLDAIKQLTQDNLSTLNERESLKKQIAELKQKAAQIDKLESRALQANENQASMKARLNQYEAYTKQLKQGMVAFKRLEIQKFNYILAKNYQEFQKVHQESQTKENLLQEAAHQMQQLTEQLQRQRTRLDYFQKLVLGQFGGRSDINTYQQRNDLTQAIPELSEQDNVTDRIEID